MHCTDWVPTLLQAAGAPHAAWRAPDVGSGGTVDGISVWPMLSINASSARKEILNNINEVANSAALRVGKFKVLLGAKENASSGWYDGDHFHSFIVSEGKLLCLLERLTHHRRTYSIAQSGFEAI